MSWPVVALAFSRAILTRTAAATKLKGRIFLTEVALAAEAKGRGCLGRDCSGEYLDMTDRQVSFTRLSKLSNGNTNPEARMQEKGRRATYQVGRTSGHLRKVR